MSSFKHNNGKATAERLRLHREDPEWAQKRNAAVGDGQRRRWAEATDEDRRLHARRCQDSISDDGRRRIAATCRRNGSDPKIRRRRAETLSTTWSSLTPEQREQWTANVSKGVAGAWKAGKLDHTGVRTWYHRLPSGREILVQSSWEADCAEALEAIGATFQRGGRVILGDRSWRPDFLVDVPGHPFYLEVKGHPMAIAHFDAVQHPRLSHCPLPVAILLTSPPYPREAHHFVRLLTWLKGPTLLESTIAQRIA